MALREELQLALGPDFVVGKELGGGGMSCVFLVEDKELGRTIVAKVLAPELAGLINTSRFEREIRVAASLQQANIVPLINAGKAGDLPWFTMPYVEGESLRTRIASGTPITIAECVSIMRDVTRALGYAHERGVVHRDIKPDNVLLSRGAAEVTDFGIAKALDAAKLAKEGDTLTQLGTSVGTPAYMSPEQAAGDPDVDHRADIYSVGVLAYEMLTGKPPFIGAPQAVMAAHVHATPAPIARVDIPPPLKRVITRCLAKEPAERYQTADDLLRDIDAVSTPSGELASVPGIRRRRSALLAGGIMALGLVAWFGSAGPRRNYWVRTEAIPRIKAYSELAQSDSAWLLAREVMSTHPKDSALTALLPYFTRKGVLHSKPEGAQVYRASFEDTTHWVLLGTTPTDTILLPFAAGRLRVEKSGYRTQVGLIGGGRTFILDKAGAPDSGMVHIPGGAYNVFLVGLDGVAPDLELGDYQMDLTEVTNRSYTAFVDAGGYTKREYWTDAIPSDAQWTAIVPKLVDKTGRPGPSTWEAGAFPTGQGDYPVGGLSWYEAKAYAKFAGKSLPTVYHWARAANVGSAKYVVPGSNFDGQAARPASASRGMATFGTLDMAGNVREWCENDAGDGERYILGGGFTDPPYGFTDAYGQPPLDRSAINGMRLVKYAAGEPNLAKASTRFARAFRDYTKEKPVSDVVYESFRPIYDYDRTPLNVKVESRDTTRDDWNEERVTYDAAYGGERIIAYVLTPKNGRPPYQSMVYFPGSGVISQSNSKGRRDQVASFITKTGRALIVPVLKSTYERQDSLHSDLPDSSIYWREHVVMWVKDIRRTVDYIQSRTDMDTSRIAYFGYSWGSNTAPINLAIEPRLKAATLYVAGLTMERGRPEVDPLNYLSRVRQPVLLLNGKYDFFFPLELSQKPFFDYLGTPPDRKTFMLYEGGHDVPRTELIKETLAWLDRYLGPVQR